MKSDDLTSELVEVFMSPKYDQNSRALLYAQGKKEGIIRDEIASVISKSSAAMTSQIEFSVDKDSISRWNDKLRHLGYFDSKWGLNREKKNARIDVVAFENGVITQVIEVKAWSSGDAVDLTRFGSQKKHNHSISRSFEIDALKLLSVAGDRVQRTIVTALFTIHCDGLSLSDIRQHKLAYPGLLHLQNRDKAGIGSSFDYRATAIRNMTSELNRQFGLGTVLSSRIHHKEAFSAPDGLIDGVGVSMDLFIAEIGTAQ